jgi:DNA-binding NtrC family response regulator
MRFTDDALSLLEAYDWPGNVRELENTIQRACALSNSDVLLPSDIPLGSTASSRHNNPASTVTRMRDALTTLIHVAQTTPDMELIPWIEKELTRLAYRHFEENAPKTAKFLGLKVTEVQARLEPGATKKPVVKKAVD